MQNQEKIKHFSD